MQSKRECEQWCERVNPENKAALEAWVRETGIHPPGAGQRAKKVWRATPRLGGQPATFRVRGVYWTTTPGRL